MQQKDDGDMGAVDELMKQYDSKEKNEKQNEEFVKVLKKDDKLLNFFIENYQPGADAQDDEKFISYEFSKFSEKGWSEDGKELDTQVLSKKKARKFAGDVVAKWKGFDVSTEDEKKRTKMVDDFLAKGKLFDKTWKKFDSSGKDTGSIALMEAHDFIKAIIPRADTNIQSQLEEQIDKTLSDAGQ